MRLSVRQREFLQALSQTETLSPDELQLYQRKLLEPLLKHAMTNVPFYRCRLEPVFGNGAFDWNRWREIPTFNRLEARAAGIGLQTETLPVGNDRWVEQETFGSTLAPLRHRRSNLNDLASRCQAERAYDWWRMDVDQTLAMIGLFAPPKRRPSLWRRRWLLPFLARETLHLQGRDDPQSVRSLVLNSALQDAQVNWAGWTPQHS